MRETEIKTNYLLICIIQDICISCFPESEIYIYNNSRVNGLINLDLILDAVPVLFLD